MKNKINLPGFVGDNLIYAINPVIRKQEVKNTNYNRATETGKILLQSFSPAAFINSDPMKLSGSASSNFQCNWYTNTCSCQGWFDCWDLIGSGLCRKGVCTPNLGACICSRK